jgi:hypothetical protein
LADLSLVSRYQRPRGAGSIQTGWCRYLDALGRASWRAETRVTRTTRGSSPQVASERERWACEASTAVCGCAGAYWAVAWRAVGSLVEGMKADYWASLGAGGRAAPDPPFEVSRGTRQASRQSSEASSEKVWRGQSGGLKYLYSDCLGFVVGGWAKASSEPALRVQVCVSDLGSRTETPWRTLQVS